MFLIFDKIDICIFDPEILKKLIFKMKPRTIALAFWRLGEWSFFRWFLFKLLIKL